MATATRCFPFALLLLFSLVGYAGSDFASDQAECADSLVGLSACLQYVGSSARAPTPDCCKGLTQVLEKSKKCLCILIKDRDDPSLGLKINLTRALTLPVACGTHANISQCIDLLHLAPNSTDAQAFKQFAGNSPALSAPSTEQGNSSRNSNDRSTGGSPTKNSSNGRKEQWMAMETLLGLSLWCLVRLL
ncbi:non-specific lipid transfer protein GPI-anchored 14-like [Aristolochia californica]|uniref:non-specific lipid transfer protein GPI-anchored 14-like n=1 Tax=Aristolochia californica TaxID=171875 RepID=UPI0035E10EB8